MANFSGTIITNKGLNLLAKALQGAEIVFTRVALGDGLWEGINPEHLDSLVSEKHSLPIQGIETTGQGTARIRTVLLNNQIQNGFFARELGVFAQDPELGEILYAVSYAGEQADYIPPGGNITVETILDVYVIVDRAEHVTAWINDTVVLATKQDITEHNESPASHPDIRQWLNAHQNSPYEHNIPQQIQYAIENHGHDQYTKAYIHEQEEESLEWDILHNLNTTVPIVRAYSVSQEEVILGGYCGSGLYCGQEGVFCGNTASVLATKLQDILYSSIVILSQNRALRRFSFGQKGIAKIIG